ncbi:MAG: C4-dicarboxylate ABC transporter substrate-binding protein, partial [Pseudomonadota bacterium]
MMISKSIKGLAVAAVAALGLSGPASAQEPANYILATASTGGTY